MSVIYILKAMGPRNTLVIRYCCHGLKYNRQEFFLRSELKPDLDLTPSPIQSPRQAEKERENTASCSFFFGDFYCLGSKFICPFLPPRQRSEPPQHPLNAPSPGLKQLAKTIQMVSIFKMNSLWTKPSQLQVNQRSLNTLKLISKTSKGYLRL